MDQDAQAKQPQRPKYLVHGIGIVLLLGAVFLWNNPRIFKSDTELFLFDKHMRSARSNLKSGYFDGAYDDLYEAEQIMKDSSTKELRVAINKAQASKAAADRRMMEMLNRPPSWTIGHYVDKFGDRTDKAFLTITFKKRLYAASKINATAVAGRMSVDPLSVSFKLDDVSFPTPGFSFQGDNITRKQEKSLYDISVKDASGQVHELRGHRESGSDEIQSWFDDVPAWHSILLKGGTLSVLITDKGNSKRQYRFDINSSESFADVWQKMQGEAVTQPAE